MDRMLYIATNGAGQAMRAQTEIAHNLANASTVGFKANLDMFGSLALKGDGFDSRVYNQYRQSGVDFSPGSLMTTGRELDVAVKGEGWIAVLANDGTEAYTRAGDLRVDANGLLTTGTGLPVLGNGGPIAIPPFQKLDIASDGSISVIPVGQTADTVALVDRIKLVKPDPAQLTKGEDGLIRLEQAGEAVPDAAVTLVSGVLEGSNVNAVSQLVELIENARNYEAHVKMMRTAKETDESSAQLLRMG